MGVVNVTPDSFSDGGLFLDPGAAIAHGLELERRGRGDPRHRRRVDPPRRRAGAPRTRSCARVLPVIEGLRRGRGAGADLDRHLEGRRGRGGAARRGDARQRRDRAARRSRDGRGGRRRGRRLLPDAHARRAAHDAATTRATTTSSARSRRFSRSGWASRSRRASPRSGSCSTPGSASARRRPQPRAAAPPRRARGARAPGADRHLAQVVPRARSPAATVDDRLAGDDRHQRARLRPRGAGVPRPRRGPGP